MRTWATMGVLGLCLVLSGSAHELPVEMEAQVSDELPQCVVCEGLVTPIMCAYPPEWELQQRRPSAEELLRAVTPAVEALKSGR